MPSTKKNRNRSGKPPSDLGRMAKELRSILAGRRIDDVSHVEMMGALARAAGSTLNVAIEQERTPRATPTPEPVLTDPTPSQIALLNRYPDIEVLGLPADVREIDHAVRHDPSSIGDTLFRFLWIEIGETEDPDAEESGPYEALDRAIEEISGVQTHLPRPGKPCDDRYAVHGMDKDLRRHPGTATAIAQGLGTKIEALARITDAGPAHPFYMVSDGRGWTQFCATTTDGYSIHAGEQGTAPTRPADDEPKNEDDVVTWEVQGYHSQAAYDGHEGFATIDENLTSMDDAMRIGRAALREYAVVKVQSSDREVIEVLASQDHPTPAEQQPPAPTTAEDPECAVGLHDWIDKQGKLPPDTKCGRCGEEYGHPD